MYYMWDIKTLKKTFHLTSLYQELNKKYFGGILGDVKFEVDSHFCVFASSVATIFTYKKPGGENMAIIKFNTSFDWNEQNMRQILLHEMIHYYIFVKFGRRLLFSHGLPFIWIMMKINRKYGENIKLYWL